MYRTAFACFNIMWMYSRMRTMRTRARWPRTSLCIWILARRRRSLWIGVEEGERERGESEGGRDEETDEQTHHTDTPRRRGEKDKGTQRVSGEATRVEE